MEDADKLCGESEM